MPVDRQKLTRHLQFLCRKPRPAMSEELEIARVYVEDELASSGWITERQKFQAENKGGLSLEGTNIVARHSRCSKMDESAPLLIVGAHLDSCANTPGADDNASAVAAMLEIARLISVDSNLNEVACRLELVAFDLEEEGMLGGARHAAVAKQSGRNVVGMVSLEMLGYCDHAVGSQQLPEPLVGLYPDTANFIAIVGNQNSTKLIQAYKQGMQKVKGLPVEYLQVLEDGRQLEPTRLSDHSPFWDAGFAALMITDTSFMRNPHYHQETDTPETLDMEFLHKVTEGSLQAVSDILRHGL